jgi:hypothetical protein
MDEFLNVGKTLVKEIGEGFKEPDDDWTMWLLMEVKAGEVMVVELPAEWANSDLMKEAIGRLLAEYAKKVRLLKVGLVSSSWQVEGTKKDLEALQRIRPSQHPNRFEAVLVVGVDPEIQKMISARIIRTETEPPKLADWQDMELDGLDGKMMGPLVQVFR